MAVAQHTCGIVAYGVQDSVPVVLIVCKRCGYLMPLAADRLSGPAPLAVPTLAA